MKLIRGIALLICFLIIGKAFAQVRDSIPLIVADSLKAVYIYADTGKAPNRTDAQGRKQGLWEKRYPNGKLRYRGHFVNDKPNAVFKYFWDNDSMQNIAVYSDNGKVAYSKMFYENGGVFSMGKFITEKRDSIWLFYDEGLKLIKKEQYVVGKKEGKSVVFGADGNVIEMKTWHNDVENGPWLQYFPDGQVKLKTAYLNGKREGEVTLYSDGDESVPSIQGFYRNDCKDGKWIYLDSRSGEHDTIVYKNDKPVDDAKYRLTKRRIDSLKMKYQDSQQRLDHPGNDMENYNGGGGDDGR